ncbi:MAG TPA: geranylgeranylglyceryl/heptaprenylglyceryl phosphate synthase [Bacteroidales bacterium]|nr:geranylgeranylglyceryl/heptaprenylglyceryl phosphate synthase [Bacteroidales bacterium]
MHIYELIKAKKGKQFAILVDPEQCMEGNIKDLASLAAASAVDYILVGGSLLVNDHLDKCIQLIKSETDLPVILFPGSEMQINGKADAILLLSLISGRNPELLIGKHVLAAPYLRASGLEILPTGYMLIESGNSTTALYMSNTNPIPREKNDIAVCTAMAGEMLGLKMIYMDAGSGAAQPIPVSMISSVKEQISIPLIIGGGIRTPEIARESCQAGADMIVVGTAIENDLHLIREISDAVKNSQTGY